jgi:hypothetical protein
MYGTDGNCPGCTLQEETLQHVLVCTHLPIAACRLEEFAKFAQALIKVHTTPTVLKCIMFGVHTWVENPEKRVHSPTFGSLRGPDVQLTAVFHEQYYVLGWYQFCLGRISNLWMKSVSLYNPAINLTH